MTSDQPTDLQVLEFAGRRYRHAGARLEALRAELGVSDTEFARRLLGIVRAPSPEVIEAGFGPLLNRLRRQVDAGVRRRGHRAA